MFVEAIDGFSNKYAWTKAIESYPFGYPLQTVQYADIMMTSFNYKPIFYAAKENEEIVGGLLVFLKEAVNLPVIKKFSLVYMSYGGPFLLPVKGLDEKEILDALMQKIESDTKGIGTASLTIDTSPLRDMPDYFLSRGFHAKDRANIVVDLNEEDYLKTIDSEARKNARRAVKKGLVVTECDDEEDLKTCYEMYKAHHIDLGLEPYPYTYYKKIWELRKDNFSKVFLAKINGEVAAGFLCFTFNKYLLEMGVPLSEKYKRIYPNDLLKMHVVEWAKANHFRYVDFSSIDPNAAPGTKEFAINKFKEKWGSVKRYHMYDKSSKIRKDLYKIIQK